MKLKKGEHTFEKTNLSGLLWWSGGYEYALQCRGCGFSP